MIETIAKLLALAEGAKTEEEAAAAFGKAQALASKYSLDIAVAAARTEPAKREVPETRTLDVGARRQHKNKPLIRLASRIADANDIDLLIYASSTKIIATGMPSDLDTFERLWASIGVTMVAQGDALIRDKNADWRKETRHVQEGGSYWGNGGWVEKPMSAQSARMSFYDGFTSVVGDRLAQARDEAVTQAQADHFHNDGAPADSADNLPSSMALVIKEKKVEVAEAQATWYRDNFGGKPRGTWNGRSSASHSRSAYGAGRSAGSRANLGGTRGAVSA
jgi:hypothetical protein